MKTTFSLRRVIALAVIAGLLLPALFSGWQTLQRQRATLTLALENDLQHITTLLANGVAPSFWNFDIGAMQALTKAAAADERVVRISLDTGDASNGANISRDEIPGFYRPDRQHGRLLAATKPVEWRGGQLGTVHLEMDTGQLEARLRQDFDVFLVTAAAQIALSLTLIMLILNARFVAPIKRLLMESAQLARRELDQPFVWRRRDELGALGNSLESTRVSLQAAFKEIQDSEQRFRSLTSLSSDWYWERDEQDRLLMISPGYEEITGIAAKDVLGSKRKDRGNFTYPSKRWDEYEKRFAAREAFHDLEWSMLRRDGAVRYGTTSGEPIFDANGVFRGYRGIGKDITAAKLAEATQKSVARLRQLVEHLPAGAIYIEGGATLLNQAAEQITGYPRSEISSTSAWFEKMFAEDAEHYRRQYEEDKAAGFPTPREIEIRRRNGVSCSIEFAAYSDNGNEFWLLHDVTQRKVAEAALQQTLQEQQILLDNALVGIQFIKDRVIQRCNRGFEDMLGYGPGELPDQPTRVYYSSDESYEAHGRQVYPMIDAGEAAIGEWLYVRKDGKRIWVSYHGRAVDPSDPAKGSIWVDQDITARKHSEDALKQALLEQQAIFDNANAGINLVKDRIFMRCNRGFEEMLGYEDGELTGKPTRLIYPTDEAYETFGRTAYEAIKAGENWIGEAQLVRKDGRVIWCSGHGRALDTTDLEKGTLWILQDITERKRTEEALKRALLEQQALLDNSAIGIAYVKNRIVVRSNGGIERILGYESGEMTDRSTRCWYGSDAEYEAIGAKLLSLTHAGHVYAADMQLMRKDGTAVWCSFNAKAVRPGRPEEGGVLVLQDISARKDAEAALVDAKNRLELGLAEVEQTYREVTLLGELSSFLQACQVAQEAYASLGAYVPRLFPASGGALYLMDESGELVVQATWGEPADAEPSFLPGGCWALRRGQPYRVDNPQRDLCCPHLHGGGERLFSYACLPLVAQGETFGLLFIEHRQAVEEGGKREMRHRLAVALAEQAGLALANIRLREALHLQSIRDPLTGLYNRRYMNDVLHRELSRARRGHESLAVAIVDIDFFKHFNDSFGHDAGDCVLQHVAKLLETCVRQSDVVCRFGGEEFVLLMPEISCELAERRVGELLEAVRKLDVKHGNRALGRITVSLGLAFYPQHADDTQGLLEAADAALYRAKEGGRDRFVIGDAVQVPER